MTHQANEPTVWVFVTDLSRQNPYQWIPILGIKKYQVLRIERQSRTPGFGI
jgi:hypothetical protein